MKKGLILVFTLIFMCSFLMSDVIMELGNIDSNNGTVEILIDTDVDIMGFQFDLDGIDLTGGNGGIASDNGFDVYASGNTAIGFSLDGNIIPAGSIGILTVLEGANVVEVCLPFVQDVGPEDDTPILSDAEGNALDNITIGSGECSLFNNGINTVFSLLHTYPNPFNPELNIDVSIEKIDDLNVSIYNLNGQHIKTIYNGIASKNKVYNLKWNASGISSGIYIVQVKTSDSQYSNIVNLLK